MISDLEKYGLVALTVVIVLIVFIAINDSQDESDPMLNGVVFDDSLNSEIQIESKPLEEIPEVVVLEDTEQERPNTRAPFNFMEETVNYPGSPSAEQAAAGGASPKPLQGGEIYTVRKGDSLSRISSAYYGSPIHWKRIVDANDCIDPDRLSVGQKILIPTGFISGNRAAPDDRGGVALASSASGADSYKVKKGDTLGKIAKRIYGSAGKWEKILAANRSAIQDPRRLQIGETLVIPR